MKALSGAVMAIGLTILAVDGNDWFIGTGAVIAYLAWLANY